MTRMLVLFAVAGAQIVFAAGKIDPVGVIQCKTTFTYSSKIRGEEEFAKIKQPTMRGPGAFEAYQEAGPTLTSRLQKEGGPNEVNYYSNYVGVKVHSAEPNEDYDYVFSLYYDLSPLDKSKNRTVSIGIGSRNQEETGSALFHVIPNQGINGFLLKPGEGLLNIVRNPKINIDPQTKKYPDEVLTEIELECTNKGK